MASVSWRWDYRWADSLTTGTQIVLPIFGIYIDFASTIPFLLCGYAMLTPRQSTLDFSKFIGG